MNLKLVPLLPLLLLFATPAGARELTADEIANRAEQVNPGSDQVSKLTFIVKEADGAERKTILRRYWKNYGGRENLLFKSIVFHEYPPESRGTSFMVWSYVPGAGKPDDRWLYLTVLDRVNKLPNTDKDQGFGSADLKASDMAPRTSGQDKNRLIGEEVIENKSYYVVESVPVRRDNGYNYGKVIKWITQDDFLKERIDYYDGEGKLLKKQFITWKKVKDARVWEKVVISNVQTGAETFLSISEIRVDTGLRDTLFTERVMRRGAEAVR